MSREIIFQAFNWKIKDIKDNLGKIAMQGFTAVQISPLQGTKQEYGDWWIYYQPTNFKIGNQLGDRCDLIELCTEADKFNIRIIADVVLNHVANKGGGNDRFIPHDNVDAFIRDNKYFFHERKGIQNHNDRWQVTHYGIDLPDLDTSNYDLQNIMIEFLNDLIDCGVRGFRFDAAKHIELPDDYDGSHFWSRIISGLKSKDLFLYGEVIEADKETVDRYTKYINVGTNKYGSDMSKLVLWPYSHDDDKTYHRMDNVEWYDVVNRWASLLTNNKESHVLFYPREDREWQDDIVREINMRG